MTCRSHILQCTKIVVHHYSNVFTHSTFSPHVVDKRKHYHMEAFPLQEICAHFSPKVWPDLFVNESLSYSEGYRDQLIFMCPLHELYKKCSGLYGPCRSSVHSWLHLQYCLSTFCCWHCRRKFDVSNPWRLWALFYIFYAVQSLLNKNEVIAVPVLLSSRKLASL